MSGPISTPGPVSYSPSLNNQSPPASPSSSPKTPTRNLGHLSLYYPSSTRQCLDIEKARDQIEKEKKKSEKKDEVIQKKDEIIQKKDETIDKTLGRAVKAEKKLEKNNIFYPTQESQNQTEVSFPNHTQLQEQHQPTFVDGGIQTDPKDDIDVLNAKNESNNKKLQDKEQEISQLNDKVTSLSVSILSEAEKSKAEKEKRQQAERDVQQANQQISYSQSNANTLQMQNNILTNTLSNKDQEISLLNQQLSNSTNQTTEQLIDAYLNDVVLKDMSYEADIGIYLPFVGAAISLATWNPIPYLATAYIGLGINEGACKDMHSVSTNFKAFFLQHKEEFLIDKKAVFDKACDKFHVTFIKRTFV